MSPPSFNETEFLSRAEDAAAFVAPKILDEALDANPYLEDEEMGGVCAEACLYFANLLTIRAREEGASEHQALRMRRWFLDRCFEIIHAKFYQQKEPADINREDCRVV